ncbi:MAG: YjbQ family protein [Myxococcales bacterium]|nr:YjbQ family protein [Myxococcales bacterium]
MKVHQQRIEVTTSPHTLTDVTTEVAAVVARSAITTGLCTVFIQHTSAGLVIQENADPAVLRDLARWIAGVAPEGGHWEHDAEGPDDMPAHARSVLTRTSKAISVADGRLALGTWQALYVWEHRARRHVRSLVVHVAGV